MHRPCTIPGWEGKILRGIIISPQLTDGGGRMTRLKRRILPHRRRANRVAISLTVEHPEQIRAIRRRCEYGIPPTPIIPRVVYPEQDRDDQSLQEHRERLAVRAERIATQDVVKCRIGIQYYLSVYRRRG